MPSVRVSGRFFDTLGGHPDGRRQPFRRSRFALVLILLAGWIVGLPLAAAHLPDPLWVGGVYDGGDYDSLIACSSDAQGPEESFVGQSASRRVTGLVAPTDPIVKSSEVGSSLKTRSPPSS